MVRFHYENIIGKEETNFVMWQFIISSRIYILGFAAGAGRWIRQSSGGGCLRARMRHGQGWGSRRSMSMHSRGGCPPLVVGGGGNVGFCRGGFVF